VVDSSWKLDEKITDLLSPFEQDFLRTELGRSLEYYRRRLKKIGFEGKDRVLDAACGMGQWSLALATLNSSVIGLDQAMPRLCVANELKKANHADNLQIKYGDFHHLPLETGSLEAVFCNIALMYGRIEEVLAEFSRVLKKGGEMYVNAAGYGYYLDLVVSRGLANKDIRLAKLGIKIIVSSLLGGKKDVAVSAAGFRAMIEKAGFKIKDFGLEGELTGDPIYKKEYKGLPCIFETVAVKL